MGIPTQIKQTIGEGGQGACNLFGKFWAQWEILSLNNLKMARQ